MMPAEVAQWAKPLLNRPQVQITDVPEPVPVCLWMDHTVTDNIVGKLLSTVMLCGMAPVVISRM